MAEVWWRLPVEVLQGLQPQFQAQQGRAKLKLSSHAGLLHSFQQGGEVVHQGVWAAWAFLRDVGQIDSCPLLYAAARDTLSEVSQGSAALHCMGPMAH